MTRSPGLAGFAASPRARSPTAASSFCWATDRVSSGAPSAEPQSARGWTEQPAQRGIGPCPAAAATVFGAWLQLAVQYAALLVSAGVVRGLIGPHEPSRIWSRHLLNCAAVVELFTAGQRVVDVGAGAGL